MRGEDDSADLDALQSVLSGEHMAIGIYKAVLNTVHDPDVKKRLEEVLGDHERHADELAARIADLGGEPNKGVGISGWTARAGVRLRGWFQDDPRGILRQVYDGEDQGIAAAANIADRDLDEESRALIEKIISEDRTHLGQLEAVIAAQTGDN